MYYLSLGLCVAEHFENNIVGNNFHWLRSSLELAAPPCLPYLLIYLSDLTFIEENSDQLENGLINFEKSQMIAKVIVQIQQYQQKPYMFYLVPQIQQYMDQALSSGLLNEREAFDLSLKIEPRERLKSK